VAIALHVPAEGASPEDSSRYDLALLDVEGGQTTTIRGAVGMWAQPVFSAVSGDGSVRLAYGVSLSPEESANSAYELWVADADGSDAGRLYPREEGLGARLLDFAWSPDGGSVLVVDGGDLVLCSVASRQVTPLLQGVEAIRVRWAP
jgi:hypothetical protein